MRASRPTASATTRVASTPARSRGSRAPRRPRRSSPRAMGRPGKITKLEKKEQREKAPMLYDLTTLQREANNRYGFSAKRTLGGGAALLRGAQGADISEDELALSDERHGRRNQADRRARRPRQPDYTKGAEYVIGLDLLAARARRQRREGHRPPRDHPDALRAQARENELRRPPDLRHGHAALPRRLPPGGGVREHARRDDRRRAGAHLPHARQAADRARLARRLRRGRRRRAAGERRGGRGRRPAAAATRGRRDRQDTRDRRAIARKRNRRGATATLRCSARWRRPASLSTTKSCARR